MLKDRVAVVTGSTRGIGLGIARALAAEGCALMLNGFGDADEIARLPGSIASEFGVEVYYNGADVARPQDCTDLVADAELRLGRIDFLINNAGIQFVSPVESFPPDKWDAIIATNLSAVFHTTRAVLPGMRRRGFGRVINIASVHGMVASENKCAYVAAKHGLIGLTKTVALETAESGITANAICPGWVETAMVRQQIEARAANKNISIANAERELLVEKQPSARFTTIEQIGALTVFLCGPAADNITGASLTLDGGWTAR
jgi:3-hydroxybutyrate dehydrogenase